MTEKEENIERIEAEETLSSTFGGQDADVPSGSSKPGEHGEGLLSSVNHDPASAGILPLDANEEPSSDEPSVSAEIFAKLKNTREQREVAGPLVQLLVDSGWQLDQLVFGKKEWRVPKTPSEATKRERGNHYEGFPCDVAIFDAPERRGDPRHLIAIIETKVADEDAGVDQLESYMGLEPHVRLGIWTNNADPSSPVVFVYRDRGGRLVRRNKVLSDLPRPGEPISTEQKRLTFDDLTEPSESAIRRTFEELLDRVVVNDSNVTRREEQLDQLCNLLLLKLHSDRRAKLRRSDPPLFRPLESPARTAEEIRREFSRFVGIYPDTFTTTQDRELRLADGTIQDCVERLAPYKLIDMGVSVLSMAFQVLRTAALRQDEGQYFTPQPVIEAGIRLLKVDLGDLVIDPACGTGGFLVNALAEMQRKYPGADSEISRWAQTNLHGIDKDSVGLKLTKATMQIAGDGSAHCVKGDAVRTYLWAADYPHLTSGAFSNGRFDVVVTNPPFGKNLKVSAEDARLAGLDIAIKDNGEYRDLEIGLLFLQRAHQLLRLGGRLGIILPETYFFSPQYRFLFEWIKGRLRPTVVANVPMEAFAKFCRAKTNFYVFEKVG